MRCGFFAVLVVVIVLTVAGAAKDSNPSRSIRLLTDNPAGVSTERLLSSTEAVDENEEARAIAVPGLSKIKEWITANVSRFKTWYSNRKQANAWLKEEKTPDDVFKLLKLDQNLETVLNNPKLTLWAGFLVKYNKKNPETATTLLGMLVKHYGIAPVAKALETARLNPKGPTFRLADSLQTHELLGWRQNGLSTDVVFDMLKLSDDTVEKLLSNPALNVWVYYFFRSNRHNPDMQVNLIAKLRTHYDDMALAKVIEAAAKEKRATNAIKILQEAQFKSWLLEGKDPAKIFKMLKLETAKRPYDPNVDVYSAYGAYYKANKGVE